MLSHAPDKIVGLVEVGFEFVKAALFLIEDVLKLGECAVGGSRCLSYASPSAISRPGIRNLIV
jgi:hypothetical protein